MIQVVQRALDILNCLGQPNGQPIRLSEIAQKTGLNPGTTARILKTLVAEGFAEQIGRREGYILGPMLHTLAAKGAYRQYLVTLATPFMVQLAQAIHENVILSVLRQNQRVVLLEIPGQHQVQITPVSQQHLTHPLQTATGRLLTAFLPEEQQRAIIGSANLSAYWPEQAGTSEETLREIFSQIRRDGFVIRQAEMHVVGTAFAIYEQQQVSAALGVHLPAYRFVDAHRGEVLEKTKAAAEDISRHLNEIAR